MRRRNESSLKEAVERLIASYGLREKLDEQAMVSIWDDIAGGMVAKHTEAVKLNKGKLRIKVDSAPLRHELTMMRDGLVKLINTRFEREVVKEITIE